MIVDYKIKSVKRNDNETIVTARYCGGNYQEITVSNDPESEHYYEHLGLTEDDVGNTVSVYSRTSNIGNRVYYFDSDAEMSAIHTFLKNELTNFGTPIEEQQ